jgi:hypothetical protein
VLELVPEITTAIANAVSGVLTSKLPGVINGAIPCIPV